MEHLDLGRKAPASYKALAALSTQSEQAADEAGLDRKLVELVKIRASQLNGCAFCLRMHVRDAREAGESEDRLAVVAGWWESQYFSPEEQEALRLAEQITQIGAPAAPRGELPESTLTETQRAAIVWVAVVINAWNRVAITSGYPVAP